MGTSLRTFSEAAHTKIRALDDIEKRVLAMQASMRQAMQGKKQPSTATAAEIVAAEVAIARKLTDAAATCEACGKQMLPQFLKAHTKVCFADMISATGCVVACYCCCAVWSVVVLL
jgi:hypothetical protein